MLLLCCCCCCSIIRPRYDVFYHTFATQTLIPQTFERALQKAYCAVQDETSKNHEGEDAIVKLQ